MMRVSVGGLFLISFVAVTGGHLLAHDDGRFEEVAPEIRQWFRSLKIPGTLFSCCDESDCNRTEERIEGEGYLALTPDGTWVKIPDDVVVHVSWNPTGEPVLCSVKITQYGVSKWHVYCFVPGAKM